MVPISDQTYNSTREDTTVKESRTVLSEKKKRKVRHYLYFENC